MVVVIALGMTLPSYLALKRGTLVDYVKTVVSIPPLLVYLAFSNGAKVVQTLRGRRSHFKRTPKVEHVDVAPVDIDAEA